MDELIISLEDKKYDFNLLLDILISKYENKSNQGRDFFVNFMGFSITSLITYIGWTINSFKSVLVQFWTGDVLVKIILFSLLFTTFVISSWLTRKIIQWSPIENKLSLLFGLSDLRKLNQLYLLKLKPQGWELKINADFGKGIFDLVSIGKIK